MITIEKVYNFFNFLINKYKGSWYPPEEIDDAFDFGQMSFFNDCYDEFGASQRINDSLSPFKTSFQFSNGTSPGGLITMPEDYQHLLYLYTVVFDNIRGPQQRPVPIVNEDEIVGRANSQVIPNTVINPFGQLVTNWNVQLYPQTPQAGVVWYLRRPAVPKFAYTNPSGRAPIYDPDNSTQLEWAEKDLLNIILRALAFAGVNITFAQLVGWAEGRINLDSNSKVKN